MVPLDNKRHWYRYHHLFADVLRAHALEEPEEVAVRHRRASDWYERHGQPADAIRHALAAGDFARAADLVELVATAMSRSRQEATFLAWLRSLPDDVLRCRPVLSNLYAGVLLQCGEVEGVEARLRDAERWLPLVKWFLAIPHYVVLVVLNLAAVVAVILSWFAILVTGRYPRGLFSFVEGVIRWNDRVIGYALTLVTDEYPPFRLDP